MYLNFYINGKSKELEVKKIETIFGDCAKLTVEYKGEDYTQMLKYGLYNKPFLRFGSIDAILSQKSIETIWETIGSPTCGLLYSYTFNYEANWCD